MTIEQAEDLWQAVDILRRLGWGTKSAMRTRVSNYRATGNIRELEEAVTLPQNRRNKILTYIANPEIGTEYIDSCLDQLGIVTRQQLNTFSLDMCSYTQDLFDRWQAEELTPEQVATDIETNVSNPYEKFTKLIYQYSAEYRDLWGR